MIQKTNLKDSVNKIEELFSYKRVGTLNKHMLNVLQAENRTLEFHVHEASDEMFYCIEGEFDLEFEDGMLHMCEGDFAIIPKGTRHRPVCKELVKCLLIEAEGTLNKDNTGGTFETDTQTDVQLLLDNLNNIHTTEMGAERIRRNLKLQEEDVVAYCKEKISDSACRIYKQGKNWYCEIDNIVITINSYSYTIITAHKKKKSQD